MSIGVGIFLLALGAILAFAVQDRIPNVDLTAVGFILMAVSVLGMVLSMMLANRRGKREPIDPVVEEQYRIEERHHPEP
jgi:membrane protein implicated in regulation of membrane protease activity